MWCLRIGRGGKEAGAKAFKSRGIVAFEYFNSDEVQQSLPEFAFLVHVQP